MTTIIGFIDKKEKCVYLGSDSQVTYGNIKYPSNSSKILNIHNKILIGFSGSAKNFNILESSDVIFNLVKDNKITKNFLIKQFIPALYKDLDVYEGTKYDDSGRYVITLIIAYNSKIISIDASGSIIEYDKYWAEGSGSEIALGSLYTNENNEEIPVFDKVLCGLKAASNFNIHTNKPFYIYNTKDFKKIKK